MFSENSRKMRNFKDPLMEKRSELCGPPAPHRLQFENHCASK